MNIYAFGHAAHTVKLKTSGSYLYFKSICSSMPYIQLACKCNRSMRESIGTYTLNFYNFMHDAFIYSRK